MVMVLVMGMGMEMGIGMGDGDGSTLEAQKPFCCLKKVDNAPMIRFRFCCLCL